MHTASCFEEERTGAYFRILANAIADRTEDGFVGRRLGKSA